MLLRSLATVALGVAVAGCGSDGPELPADAAGICREVANRFARIQSAEPKTFRQAEAQLTALVDAAAAGDEALAAVEPGGSDAEQRAYQRYLEARAGVTDLLRRALRAVRDDDGDAYARLRDRANAAAKRRRRLARRAGLGECGRASGRLRPLR